MAQTEKFDWNAYNNVKSMLKQGFIAMPGGQNKSAQQGAGMDPSMAGGMPPPGVDPSMMGGMPPGMDPSMAGGMPPGMDPSMAGGMPPGMDPSMAGGMPPGVDPAMAGMTMAQPPAAPTGDGGSSPMITLSLDQLMKYIQKILALSGSINKNGVGGMSQDASQVDQDKLKSTIYEVLSSMMH